MKGLFFVIIYSQNHDLAVGTEFRYAGNPAAISRLAQEYLLPFSSFAVLLLHDNTPCQQDVFDL